MSAVVQPKKRLPSGGSSSSSTSVKSLVAPVARSVEPSVRGKPKGLGSGPLQDGRTYRQTASSEVAAAWFEKQWLAVSRYGTKVWGVEFKRPPVQTKAEPPSTKVSWATPFFASSTVGNSAGVTHAASTKQFSAFVWKLPCPAPGANPACSR